MKNIVIHFFEIVPKKPELYSFIMSILHGVFVLLKSSQWTHKLRICSSYVYVYGICLPISSPQPIPTAFFSPYI